MMGRAFRPAWHLTDGFLRLYFNDLDWMTCKRNELEGLLLAWRAARKAGAEATDHEVLDCYGDTVWIDLRRVVAISEITPAGIRRYDEEEEARAAYKLANGQE